LSEKQRGAEDARFFKNRAEILSSTDEDSVQPAEAADQPGGYTLGGQIFEALN
jgi:hypothetical protein